MGDNTGPADDQPADAPNTADYTDPDDADLDRLMADADPDLAAPGEPQPEADPVEAAKESDSNRVKQELDLSNPDAEASVDQFEAAEPFEPDGPIDPDRDIRDPRIRQAVRQAQEAEQNHEQEQDQDQTQSASNESDAAAVATDESSVEADPDTPVRVDNTKKPTTDTTMSDSDPTPDREPVQNSDPETPAADEMADDRYQSDSSESSGGPTDPFDGSDDEVAEAMAEWSELTTADDIDPDTFDFEDQDFEQLAGHGDEAVIPFNGLYFHLKKPEDDAAQSFMAKMQTVRDQGKMVDMVIEEVVHQPDVSGRLSEWDFWTRAGLAGRCMQFLGLDDMGEF